MPPRSEFATNKHRVSSMISELIAMIRLLINIIMRYMTEFGQSAVAAVSLVDHQDQDRAAEGQGADLASVAVQRGASLARVVPVEWPGA